MSVCKGGEGRLIFSDLLIITDKLIEIRHDVLQCIRPAFIMTARIMNEGLCFLVQQIRIGLQDLVRFLSLTDPQLLRLLLIPGYGLHAAIQLQNKLVLPPSTDL
ncbi:hypothetical protein D3C87_1153490 [compost metagenome]